MGAPPGPEHGGPPAQHFDPYFGARHASEVRQPMTAYQAFVAHERPTIVREHPDAKATEVMTIADSLWEAKTLEEREPFERVARADRERYERESAQAGYASREDAAASAALAARRRRHAHPVAALGRAPPPLPPAASRPRRGGRVRASVRAAAQVPEAQPQLSTAAARGVAAAAQFSQHHHNPHAPLPPHHHPGLSLGPHGAGMLAGFPGAPHSMASRRPPPSASSRTCSRPRASRAA